MPSADVSSSKGVAIPRVYSHILQHDMDESRFHNQVVLQVTTNIDLISSYEQKSDRSSNHRCEPIKKNM